MTLLLLVRSRLHHISLPVPPAEAVLPGHPENYWSTLQDLSDLLQQAPQHDLCPDSPAHP
jgi:hypothetical protein